MFMIHYSPVLTTVYLSVKILIEAKIQILTRSRKEKVSKIKLFQGLHVPYILQ